MIFWFPPYLGEYPPAEKPLQATRDDVRKSKLLVQEIRVKMLFHRALLHPDPAKARESLDEAYSVLMEVAELPDEYRPKIDNP